MPQISTNYKFSSRQPLDARDVFNTIALMKAVKESSINEGHISYCKETKKHYVFNPNNTFDDTTGYWRELKTGSNGGNISVEDAKVLNVYTGLEAPADEDTLWIYPEDDDSAAPREDETVVSLKKQIAELNKKYEELSKILEFGIVPGNMENGTRQEMIKSAEPLKPEGAPEDAPDIEIKIDEERPDTDFAAITVPHNCVKLDTTTNITKNRNDLVDGELLFYTDRKKFAVFYQGQLYVLNGGGGTLDPSEPDTPDFGDNDNILTMEQIIEKLENNDLQLLRFKDDNDKSYRLIANTDGELQLSQIDDEITDVPQTPDKTWGVYLNPLLSFNTIFCGGKGSIDSRVSHNFIELANASKKDVNLNGLYILHTDCTRPEGSTSAFNWDVLPLKGIIKAGGTFVIRGRQCNVLKDCLIKVDSYDMEWRDKDTNQPKVFSQGQSAFFLAVGDAVAQRAKEGKLGNPWSSTDENKIVGYIDSCGFGPAPCPAEGTSQMLLPDSLSWDKILFVRWYMFEPAKQGNKDYTKRKTPALWTYINLDKQTEYGRAIPQYYWDDERKKAYAPKASKYNKGFFTVASKFKESEPNIINVTFGKQATDNGVYQKATRCFNWVSVGNHREYVEYYKEGDSEHKKQYSFDSSYDSYTEDYRESYIKCTERQYTTFYKNLRWCTPYGVWVTSHKAIVRGLSEGKYKYRICRENSKEYSSDWKEFTVHGNKANFSFIQVTDQQGFNWQEYTAWAKTADAIKSNSEKLGAFDFTINTGDITQSGNRPSEWLDYYSGRRAIEEKEEMFTIGNNDLCGKIDTQLTDGNDITSKYSHINVLKYYLFEVDPNNETFVTWTSEKTGPNYDQTKEITSPIYSLYSFNYANYHFISLNSEIAIYTSKMFESYSDSYGGSNEFNSSAYQFIETWLENDLRNYYGSESQLNDCKNTIIYMHEMPFTIAIGTFFSENKANPEGTDSEGKPIPQVIKARSGGFKGNDYNKNGKYRFSQLFKKYGIRLVMGGHKHTYSISKPIYDAPEDYETNGLLNTAVSNAMSRKPVVEVLSNDDIPAALPTDDDLVVGRYKVVNKFSAPTYVMCQASGYKLVSNKELPACKTYDITWLLSYYKSNGSAGAPIENPGQHKPMFIKYDLTSDYIDVTAYQTEDSYIQGTDTGKNPTFDINDQVDKGGTITAMTLKSIEDNKKLLRTYASDNVISGEFEKDNVTPKYDISHYKIKF